MIEVNKNTLAGALPALGNLICRTSPITLFKSIKVESADGKLRLSTCGASEEIAFELESGSEDVFCCMVGFDEFRDAVRSGRNKTVSLTYEAGTLLVGCCSCSCVKSCLRTMVSCSSRSFRRSDFARNGLSSA